MTNTVIEHTIEQPPLARGAPTLLHEFFEAQVRLQPERPAVECNGELLTYAQLDQLADHMAASLQARGIGVGSLVGIYLEKSCGLFAAVLGVLKAGAGYVPIDPSFPIARVQSILEDADITVVISDSRLAKELASETACEVIVLHDELTCAPQSSLLRRRETVSPNDVCYVIYTSGSTGRPKGVVIEHRHVVNFVQSLRTVYKLTPQDRVYQGFSIAFDASVEEIWAAFSIGGTLVVPNSAIARSAIDAADFINLHKITYFSTVPSLLALIRTDLPTVRLLVVGGESCSPELVQRWVTPSRRMMNTYGPTEATVVATAVDCVPGQPVTIGTPLPGYVVHVLDDHSRPVSPGGCGELYIGGASIARGYLNRPELTAERFIRLPADEPGLAPARFYRTRDLVRLTEPGGLEFIGRADQQIKIRGFRIELTEIEAVLMEHPAIQAAAVSVIEFGNLKELAAFVVIEKGAVSLDRQSVAELLRTRLPEYMIPRYLDVAASLPLMTSGKIDRKLLPPPRTVLGRSNRDIVDAKTDIESAIVDVWGRMFQMSPISIDDDFFLDLRGHSLFAAQAVTELRAKLGTNNVSVPDFYEYRTARRLAAHLEVIRRVTPPKKPLSEQTSAPQPLTRFRFACVPLQFLGILAFYAALLAPIVAAVVLAVQALSGAVDIMWAIDIATTISFFVWPSWMLLSVAAKWLFIGRYKPGRYPVWGFYYFRWWLVTRFQQLSLSEMFVGTPLMNLYFRAMGAKVGKGCMIGTPSCAAFDLISIGDDTSIGSETHILGCRIENGWLILGKVTLGSECYVGTHCCLGLDVEMQSRSRLADMSHLPDNAVLEADQGMRGSPAKPADVDLGALQSGAGPAKSRRKKSLLYGVIHLLLIYVMGYFLILSTVPALVLVGYALYKWGAPCAIGAAFVSVPFSLLWYLFLVIAVKRIAIGRILPGVYSRYSKDYVRYWFLAYLLTNTRHIVLPLYATLFLPTFLRLMGAKIGRSVEISTAMHIMPDLLDIGSGSFLADACIVGGDRYYLGQVDLRTNRIGERSFIGNSAIVPAGVDIGDNCLIGVMSTPPPGVKRTDDDTRWLGSPGFELPRTQDGHHFTEHETYHPRASLIALRLVIETLRLVLPNLIAILDIVLFCTVIVYVYPLVPRWALAIIAPCTAFVLSYVAVAIVALLKAILIGKFRPVVKPLWSGYIWRNEVVNALYEAIAAVAMTPLMSSPFISPCLRMMGCKVGCWAILETTLFSEFDLVEIGDRAALNLGATIQTHLFEDRVMKSDHLKIGNDCSVGNMAVVLYGTEMRPAAVLEPLSVLMKGETLPPSSRWTGIPTRPVEPIIEIENETSVMPAANAHEAVT